MTHSNVRRANFHLDALSLAIDAGDGATLTLCPQDWEGQTRQGLPDVGADEFVGTQ